MSKNTKKHTKQIVIDVYEDSFEVSASDGMDMLDLYLIFAGALDYLKNYAEYLDKADKVVVH